MDLDRKVKRGRDRLSQEVEIPAPSIPSEKSEQLSMLEDKIKKLLEQVETLGETGLVDEAEALMRKVPYDIKPLCYVSRSFVKSLTFLFLSRWIF